MRGRSDPLGRSHVVPETVSRGFRFYWVVSAAVCAQRCKTSRRKANVDLQNSSKLVMPSLHPGGGGQKEEKDLFTAALRISYNLYIHRTGLL